FSVRQTARRTNPSRRSTHLPRILTWCPSVAPHCPIRQIATDSGIGRASDLAQVDLRSTLVSPPAAHRPALASGRRPSGPTIALSSRQPAAQQPAVEPVAGPLFADAFKGALRTADFGLRRCACTDGTARCHDCARPQLVAAAANTDAAGTATTYAASRRRHEDGHLVHAAACINAA